MNQLSLLNWLYAAIGSSVFTSAIGFIFRDWILARLKGSISKEYSMQLQVHKRDMDRELQEQKALFEDRLQNIKLQHDINQTRTSLFFDHQRTAFVEIITAMAQVLDAWWETYDAETSLLARVPRRQYSELRNLAHRHQLFLGPEATACISLLFRVYDDSLPFQENPDHPAIARDTSQPHQQAEYLLSRIAALFQKEIGISYDETLIRELGLFGAIYVIRMYGYVESNLLVYLTDRHADTEDLVTVAEANFDEFVLFATGFTEDCSRSARIPKSYLRMLRSFISMLEIKPNTQAFQH